MIREMIAILDFGSQYGQLIARRVREQNVYSRICPAGAPAEELARMPLKGIILSGGPASVYQPDAPRCDERIFDLGVPILGICYGMQLGCQILGAKVIPAKSREYGRAILTIRDKSGLLANLPDETPIWASHGDQVGNLGEGFGNLIVTLLLGNFGSVFVQKREFLMLASSRRFKILPGGPNRCRIVSIHMDDYSTEISNDVVIKNLGMFTFVISSFCENCGDMQQAFFFGDLCVERIAVASLRLPCK